MRVSLEPLTYQYGVSAAASAAMPGPASAARSLTAQVLQVDVFFCTPCPPCSSAHQLCLALTSCVLQMDTCTPVRLAHEALATCCAACALAADWVVTGCR